MKHVIKRNDHWWHGSSGRKMENCPVGEYSICGVTALECKYGLTEIKVPVLCPLRAGMIITVLELGEEETVG